jgi:hypothetical protein
VHLLMAISSNPFIAGSLTAGALLYFHERRRRLGEVAIVLVLVSLLSTLYRLASVGAALWVGAPFLMAGGILGIACLGAAVLHGQMRSVLVTAALPVGMTLAAIFLKVMVSFHPTTLDPHLYLFDQTLGGDPSFWMGRLLANSTLLRNSAFLAYIMLPIAPAFAQIFEKRMRANGILTQFLTLGFIGSFVINLLPAAGPKYAFPASFPFLHSRISLFSATPMLLPFAPRNAMPSLHMAWALLLFWHSRPWPRKVRTIFALLAVLTVMATLGLGEHYVIDLVVAFPFTFAVRAAFVRKIATSGVGALAVGVWIVLLRTGVLIAHPIPLLSWLLVAVTVGGSCWMERALFLPVRSFQGSPAQGFFVKNAAFSAEEEPRLSVRRETHATEIQGQTV